MILNEFFEDKSINDYFRSKSIDLFFHLFLWIEIKANEWMNEWMKTSKTINLFQFVNDKSKTNADQQARRRLMNR